MQELPRDVLHQILKLSGNAGKSKIAQTSKAMNDIVFKDDYLTLSEFLNKGDSKKKKMEQRYQDLLDLVDNLEQLKKSRKSNKGNTDPKEYKELQAEVSGQLAEVAKAIRALAEKCDDKKKEAFYCQKAMDKQLKKVQKNPEEAEKVFGTTPKNAQANFNKLISWANFYANQFQDFMALYARIQTMGKEIARLTP